MPVVMASAVPEQFPAILSFWLEATEIASTTDDLAGLQTLFDHDPDALVVATEDGAIVGTLIAAWDGWRAAFYRLAVRPSHRRQGLARALVAEGEARLRQHGARRVSLYAVVAHAGATAFWDAAGYEQDPKDTRFVRNLGDAATSQRRRGLQFAFLGAIRKGSNGSEPR
jgi:ribosomal protein S18 acetylase RimI-like enzyme